MDEQKKLYPLRFETVSDEAPWGRVAWKLADLGFRDSKVRGGWLDGNTLGDLMETFLERMVGDEVYACYGRQFPISVKELTVDGRMPLLVCPDDELAAPRYDALGKAKLWLVTRAGADARLYVGLQDTLNAGDFYAECLSGAILSRLHAVVPQPGEAYLIPPGCVHSARGPLQIVEIAESSDLDFPVSALGGDAEAVEEGLVEALDFVGMQETEPPHPAGGHAPHHGDEGLARPHGTSGEAAQDLLVEEPWADVKRLHLHDPLHIDTEALGRFIVYLCVSGEVSLQFPAETPDGQKYMDSHVLPAGELVLIPEETGDFYLVPRAADTVLLEIVAGRQPVKDSYLDEAGDGGDAFDGPDGESLHRHHFHS